MVVVELTVAAIILLVLLVTFLFCKEERLERIFRLLRYLFNRAEPRRPPSAGSRP